MHIACRRYRRYRLPRSKCPSSATLPVVLSCSYFAATYTWKPNHFTAIFAAIVCFDERYHSRCCNVGYNGAMYTRILTENFLRKIKEIRKYEMHETLINTWMIVHELYHSMCCNVGYNDIVMLVIMERCPQTHIGGIS